MDRWVIDTPWLARRILVSLIIKPFRPRKSAEAYQKIWDSRGSPLLFHSQDLTEALATELDAPVALAMRYGAELGDEEPESGADADSVVVEGEFLADGSCIDEEREGEAVAHDGLLEFGTPEEAPGASDGIWAWLSVVVVSKLADM